MQNKGLLIGIGVLIAASLVGGYFVFSQNQPKTSPSPVATQLVAESEVREITVEGNEYSFSPASITVTKGEKISLTFKNTGSMPHNFTVDELDVSTKTISGGQTDTIEFTANKSGTFTFYCSVGSHRSLGMEGEVEVK